MELSEKAKQSLQTVGQKLQRLGEVTIHRDIPTADTPLEVWFEHLAAMRAILGNYSNDLSLVSCLLAQSYLIRTLPMKPFDVADKPQGASGLDIDEETLDGERVIGEVKTTVPHHGTRLGAAQITAFKKDFAKLARIDAAHKFLFVTDATSFSLMTRAYAPHLTGVTVVNLTTGETHHS
ncbi:MAG: hypothetical protein ACRDJW_09215 [Thermomicrobiales bacterium]